MFVLLQLTLGLATVTGLDISVSTASSTPSSKASSPPQSSFSTPQSGSMTVQEGAPFYIRCVSRDHFSTNSSLIWEVKTKMGLSEESDYAADQLTSVLYVTRAGAKDVGRYSCVQVSSDLLDIDGSEEEESVYIYVRTLSQLTTHHPSRLVMVSSLTLPCTPTQPDVAVTVTTNGEDVTDKFQYDPTIGFWPAAITSLASTSFTCYFTLDDQTESLSVKVLSRAGEKVGAEELEVTVTSQTKQTDRLQLVCKVFRHQQRQVEIVDIYWQLPALDGQQLHKDDIVMMMRDRFTLEEVELDSVIVSTLVIEEVDEDDQGVYSCRVETIDGKIFEAETFVNVDSIPSELITILPTETGQSNMIPNNSDNAAQVGSLLSVFVYICGLLHIFYR